MKYKFRLCSKRMKDVTIEAKSHKEAIGKTYNLIKDGLDGKGVIEVSYVEDRKDTLKVPRRLIRKIVNGVIKL